ncbi:MAG TPA: GGDEF domain-containing protein [Methylophilaceae bacterium]|nr:GGDEF domain-containing protein [Methylophilaceae bacterium]
MPEFDLKTIIFMSMLLTFMLSMLLGITRVHHKGLKGPGYWAIGNLVVGLGMVLVLMQLDDNVIFLPGTALIGAGLSLYINGIQAFSGKMPDHRVPLSVFALLFVVDVYFMLINKDIRTTVIFDALIFAAVYLACARLTFAQDEGLLGNLYWITSSLFLFLGLLMIGRAISAASVDISVLNEFATWPVNAYTFMIGAVSQFFISSLFVLMLSYQLNRNLESMVTVDGMTGILNRRGLEDAANKMQGLCKRVHMGMAVLLIDIDHFKKVNDKYGHLVGDDVLRHVTKVASGALRTGDVIGRYGGEEFAVFMPNTNESEASVLAERIRAAVESHAYEEGSLSVPINVSIGAADSVRAGYDFKGLIAAADATLYAAKKAGRNRVLRYTEVKLAV